MAPAKVPTMTPEGCINECGENAFCNTTYLCQCMSGYKGDPNDKCVDVDECTELKKPCAWNSTCENYVGGYDCACDNGFGGDAKASCVQCEPEISLFSGAAQIRIRPTATLSVTPTLDMPTACFQYDVGSTTYEWLFIANETGGAPPLPGKTRFVSSKDTFVIEPSMIVSNYTYFLMVTATLGPSLPRRIITSARVHVVSSSLVAQVSGGTFRQVGNNELVEFDAYGTYDPDKLAGPANSNYSWSCSPGCDSAFRYRSDYKATLNTARLQEGGVSTVTYEFSVSVNGYTRSAAVSITVQVEADPSVPSVRLSGSTVVNRNDVLRIESEVYDRAGSDSLSLEWAETTGKLDLSSMAATELLLTKVTSSSLVIEAYILSPGQTYKFLLTATASVEGVSPRTGSAAMTVRVNEPPSGGSVTVWPPTGTSLVTRYTINTTGWVDTDEPLEYTFMLHDTLAEQATAVTLTPYQVSPRLEISSLGEGRYEVMALARDAFGAVALPTNASVTVLSSTSESEQTKTCFAQTRERVEMQSYLTLRQVNEVMGYARVLSELIKNDNTSAETVILCNGTAEAAGKRRDEVIENLIEKVDAAVTIRGNLSSSTGEQTAQVVREVTNAIAETGANISSSAFNKTRVLVEQILDTKPAARDGTSTVHDLVRIVSNLLTSSDCDRFESLGKIAKQISAINALPLAPGEEPTSVSGDRFALRTAKVSNSSVGVVESTTGDKKVLVPAGAVPGSSGEVSIYSMGTDVAKRCHSAETSEISQQQLESGVNNSVSFEVPSFHVLTTIGGQEVEIADLPEPMEFYITQYSSSISDLMPGGARIASCVFWNTTERQWSTRGCETTINGTALVCRCTHLSEFAVVSTSNKQEAKAPTDQSRGVFYALAAANAALGAVILAQLARVVTAKSDTAKIAGASKKGKGKTSIQVMFSILLAICALRVVLSLFYTWDFPSLKRMNRAVLAVLVTAPYCLECWAYSCVALQWRAIFNVSLSLLRAVKFSDYAGLYIAGCSAVTILEFVLFGYAIGGGASVEERMRVVKGGSIAVGAICLSISALLLAFGVRIGKKILRQLPDTGRRVTIAAYTVGIALAFQACVLVAGALGGFSFVSHGGTSPMVVAVGIAYTLSLVCNSAIVYLYQGSVKAVILGSKAASTKRSRSETRRSTSQRQRNSGHARGSGGHMRQKTLDMMNAKLHPGYTHGSGSVPFGRPSVTPGSGSYPPLGRPSVTATRSGATSTTYGRGSISTQRGNSVDMKSALNGRALKYTARGSIGGRDQTSTSSIASQGVELSVVHPRTSSLDFDGVGPVGAQVLRLPTVVDEKEARGASESRDCGSTGSESPAHTVHDSLVDIDGDGHRGSAPLVV